MLNSGKNKYSNSCVVRKTFLNETGGGGGSGFFLKKNILIPNVAENNILILVEDVKII